MSRTIIRFEVNATKDEQFSLRAAPTANAIAHGPAILKLDPEDQVFKDLRDSAPASGVAETAGDALRRELFKQKDIQAALTAHFGNGLVVRAQDGARQKTRAHGGFRRVL